MQNRLNQEILSKERISLMSVERLELSTNGLKGQFLQNAVDDQELTV
jgi:hypothetical protein